jgi:hypothetical protein
MGHYEAAKAGAGNRVETFMAGDNYDEQCASTRMSG